MLHSHWLGKPMGSARKPRRRFPHGPQLPDHVARKLTLRLHTSRMTTCCFRSSPTRIHCVAYARQARLEALEQPLAAFFLPHSATDSRPVAKR